MRAKYALMILGVFLLTSCINDNTSIGDGVISVIKIDETSIQADNNIEKNEVLVINPVVKQEGLERELIYTWEIDQEVYSHTQELNYIGNRLGTFQCRLIVENEDGKDFYPFVISVVTPYEQGLTMISVDEQGKSMLSFMLTNRQDGEEETFAKGDCFEINNPDEMFSSNVSDIVHCDGSLIIACKGGGTASDPGAIYYLNDKTLVVENILTTDEYPDFKPVAMGIPANGSVGVAYPIVSENGVIYEFSTTERFLAPAVKFQQNYAPCCAVYSGSSGDVFYLYFWDRKLGGLSMLYRGYGPYYCSTESNRLEAGKLTTKNNFFNEYDFHSMCLTQEEKNSLTRSELIVITKRGLQYYKTRLYGPGLYVYDSNNNTVLRKYGNDFQQCGFGYIPLEENSPQVGSAKYLALYFGNGNKVYRWNYTTSQGVSDAPVHLSVGSENAVVTSLALSDDQEKLYVAFYEPNESGLNGYVWIVSTDTGEVLSKHANVGYRPVKLIYKKK